LRNIGKVSRSFVRRTRAGEAEMVVLAVFIANNYVSTFAGAISISRSGSTLIGIVIPELLIPLV
jgi:hypothetical protein